MEISTTKKIRLKSKARNNQQHNTVSIVEISDVLTELDSKFNKLPALCGEEIEDVLIVGRSHGNGVLETLEVQEHIKLEDRSTNEKSDGVELNDGSSFARSDVYPSLSFLKEASNCTKTESSDKSSGNYMKTGITRSSQLCESQPLIQCPHFRLLSEEELLRFCHNELYDDKDEFVNRFIQEHLYSKNSLYPCLKRYKDICERKLSSEIDLASCEEKMIQCSKLVWTEAKHFVEKQGKCGDNRAANGHSSYTRAELNKSVVDEFRSLLKRNLNIRFDSILCSEIEQKCVILQIEWKIADICHNFCVAHRITKDSIHRLSNEDGEESNFVLRGALADIFYFLRFPSLPSCFTKSLTSWASDLGSVFLKCCTSSDQQFVLCQLLRLVSPVASWAAPLLQSYIFQDLDCCGPIIDHVITMIGILLSPIRAREVFLERIAEFEREESTWAIISDEGETSLTTIGENDLLVFYKQFPVEPLLAKAISHSINEKKSNMLEQTLSIISFELVLLKTLNEGLVTYCSQQYRQLCKRIAFDIRLSIRYLSEFMRSARLSFDENNWTMVFNEFERIVLHAVYYIVTTKNLGLWQFIIDFPFDLLSEMGRLRCQLLLRESSLSIADLYEIPHHELVKIFCSNDTVKERATGLECTEDANYMIRVVASIVSCSNTYVERFLNELFDICFIDELSRVGFYKVGSEAISMLIEKKPHLLSKILLLIDRNLDRLDEHAFDVLSSSPLSKCRLSMDDIGTICGKWLINRSPEHPGSRIARRLLSSLNWGTSYGGDLWLDTNVHAACAEAIAKGHLAQCRNTNSLIAKSISKVVKLASRLPDYEQQFNLFCWDMVFRLKLTPQTEMESPVNDLISYYVYVLQHTLLSSQLFLADGLPKWIDLINAGCFIAAEIIVIRFVCSSPNVVSELLQNESFVKGWDRILHCDSLSYAKPFISSTDGFAGASLKLLGSAIKHFCTEEFTEQLLIAWVKLLCYKPITEYSSDRNFLYILGVIVEVIYLNGGLYCESVVELLKSYYLVSLREWKTSSKSMLGWFSDQVPPSLIDSNSYDASPWATYIMLRAEQSCFDSFYEALYASLVKHRNYTLEQALKRAATKSHFSIPLHRLHFYRWLEFCHTKSVQDHLVFPLVCHQFIFHTFCRIHLGRTVCFADRYLHCIETMKKSMISILTQLEFSQDSVKGMLYKAISQWLSSSVLIHADDDQSEGILLSDLFQQTVSSVVNSNLWVKFVNIHLMQNAVQEGAKVYRSIGHVGPIVCDDADGATNIDILKMISLSFHHISALLPPLEPSYLSSPCEITSFISTSPDSATILSMYDSILATTRNKSRLLAIVKDEIDSMDDQYISDFCVLYSDYTVEVVVSLRCCNTFASRCARPVNITTTVTSNKYDAAVSNKMITNRQERMNKLCEAMVCFIEPTANACARLEAVVMSLENISRIRTSGIGPKLQRSGRLLFFHTASSISSADMLFQATLSTFTFALNELGMAFIADKPEEQKNLMQLCLDRSHLAHLLVKYFSPQSVSPSELLDLYYALNHAVRIPTSSPTALALLSQLDIQSSSDRLPSDQFTKLMPIAFETLVSVADTSQAIYNLFSKHFVHAMFHRFPENFIHGYKLILAACDMANVPSAILDSVVVNIAAHDMYSTEAKAKFFVDSVTASKANQLLSAQLSKSRNELGTQFFAVWSRYFPNIMLLAEYFLFILLRSNFVASCPATVMESNLRDAFDSCTLIFDPLIEPFDSGCASWNASDTESAQFVLHHFLSFLNRLHLTYDAFLPNGSKNLETIFWHFYATRIATLTRGGVHVIKLIESYATQLPWHQFFPTLSSLVSMDYVLTEGAKDCVTFVTQVFVRIQWLDVAAYHNNQPIDIARCFYGHFLSVLAICVSNPSNFAACRATLPRLINSFNQLPWIFVSTDKLSEISERIASNFPENVLINLDDVLTSFMTLYRKICCFTTVRCEQLSIDEERQKQAIYLRTHFILMLKTSENDASITKVYYDSLKLINIVVLSSEDLEDNSCCITREATSFWANVSDPKLRECLSDTLCAWLEANANSQLVFNFLQTTVESLPENLVPFGLKVLERCISCYCSRSGLRKRNVVTDWIVFTKACQRYLLTVPSDNDHFSPHLFTLNQYILQSLQNCSSFDQETSLLKSTLNYATRLKSKFVENDLALVYLIETLQALIIRQYDFSSTQSNEFLWSYIEWLAAAHRDENQSSLLSFIGLQKKRIFPVKFRLFCHIMELYLTQQTVTIHQLPRLDYNIPVLNSRIQAFRDLMAMKIYSPFEKVLSVALPFFINVGTCNLKHANDLLDTIACILYGDMFYK